MNNDILDNPGVAKNLIGRFPAFKFYLIGLSSFVLLQLIPFGLLYLHMLSISSDGWGIAFMGIIILSVLISGPSFALAILTACFSFGKSKSRQGNMVNAVVLILSITSLIAATSFTSIVWR